MTKIIFSVGTKYLGSTVKEEFDLEEDLGIEREDFDSDEDYNKAIEESYNEWVWENIDAYWNIK